MNGMDEWQKDYNERLRTAEFPTLQARAIELERADARRKAFEDAAKRIEGLDGNYIYQKAFKAAARSIRSMILGVK